MPRDARRREAGLPTHAACGRVYFSWCPHITTRRCEIFRRTEFGGAIMAACATTLPVPMSWRAQFADRVEAERTIPDGSARLFCFFPKPVVDATTLSPRCDAAHNHQAKDLEVILRQGVRASALRFVRVETQRTFRQGMGV